MAIITVFAGLMLSVFPLAAQNIQPSATAKAESTLSSTPTPSQEVYVSSLPNKGAAPELASLAWLNSTTPLRLEDLRGHVILLEFWTYSCINCVRTLPSIESWYDDYRDQGFIVIGIHFPEFPYEHDLQNIAAAAQRLNVTYPIGMDNDGATWRAYGQLYWPTMYLIDKQGMIRYKQIGEGAYDKTEAAINDLLVETFVNQPELTATPRTPLVSLTPNDVINVRSGPDVTQKSIGAIGPNMSFVILEEVSGWYKISYNDDVGYVSAEFVTVSPKEKS